MFWFERIIVFSVKFGVVINQGWFYPKSNVKDQKIKYVH